MSGSAHFLDRLDADERWDQVLSGGEKQRLGFARMLIQNPTMIVMDEATAALDPSSQDRLMRLVLERLPGATLVSVAHRVELEAFHTRKLVLEYCSEGARLVGDEALHPVAVIAGASRSRDHIRPVRQPRPARESVSADITPSRAHAVVEDFHSTAPAHIRPARRPRPARESVRADVTPSRAHAVVEGFHGTSPALAPSA